MRVRKWACKERPFTYTDLSAMWLPLTLSRGATLKLEYCLPLRLQSVGGLSEGRETTPIPQVAKQNVASRGRGYTKREATSMNIALEDTEEAVIPCATTSTQCGRHQSPIKNTWGSCAATHPFALFLRKIFFCSLVLPLLLHCVTCLTIFSPYDIKILFTIKIQY